MIRVKLKFRISDVLYQPLFIDKQIEQRVKQMKTISTIRFRPKPEHFDLVADKLKERADHWATRGTTAKVYLVQDDDELIFQIILDGMDTLIENQDEALAYLDTIRKYLIEYSEEEGHTSARTAFILYESDQLDHHLSSFNGF